MPDSSSPSEMVLTFTPEELVAQEPHIARGGLFVPTPEPAPTALAAVSLRLRVPRVGEREAAARVVQVVAGAGTALAFDDPVGTAERLAVLVEHCRRTIEAGLAGSPADEGEAGQTLYDRIRAMSGSEKMKLARTGDRAARLLLVKDTNKTVHLALIQNRGLTIDEVKVMAANRQLNPEALRLIGEHRDWTRNPGVVSALVSNPKTPTPAALKLIERLQTTELRRLARSSNATPAVAAAARRRLVGHK